MLFRRALAGALALGAATPAFADYWIVRSPDRRCAIVDEQPDTADASMQVVGQQLTADASIQVVGQELYVTREAAEEDIQVACRQ